MSSLKIEHPGSILTFVHGTWAKKSLWPELESAIGKVLPKPVEVHYPQWTGWNRVSSRSKAVSELQEHVLKWPSSDTPNHYLVGHSHGGTVATLALRNPEVRKRVAALVCLSTPFFHVAPRRLGPLDQTLLTLGALVQIGVLTWFAASSANVSNAFGIAAIGAGLSVAAIVALAFVSVLADHLRRQMSLPDVDSVPTLIVRAPADDATLPLTFFQTIGWVCQRVVFQNVARLAAVVHRVWMAVLEPKEHQPAAIASLGFAVTCFAFACWWTEEPLSWRLLFPTWPSISWEATAWTYGLAVGIPIASLALIGVTAVSVLEVAAVMAAASSFLVGREMILGGLMFDAYVEAAPPGQYDFIQLPPREDPDFSRMQHSTHSDPAAIEKVAQWLEKHVKNRSS